METDVGIRPDLRPGPEAEIPDRRRLALMSGYLTKFSGVDRDFGLNSSENDLGPFEKNLVQNNNISVTMLPLIAWALLIAAIVLAVLGHRRSWRARKLVGTVLNMVLKIFVLITIVE